MPKPTAHRRVPWAVKVLYTAFMAVLVPYYWSAYGPTNFLYFCDVALFLTLAAVWTGRPLLASMAAVGILLPQSLWMADFLGGLAGRPVTGMTGYMFDEQLPPFTRGLSLFHFWLPLVLVWLVARLGYDRRALAGWTVLAWGLLLVCYFLMPAPPRPADAPPGLPVNINYVYGPGDDRPQDWMHPLLYLGVLMVGLPACVSLPTHLLLRLAFGRPGDSAAPGGVRGPHPARRGHPAANPARVSPGVRCEPVA